MFRIDRMVIIRAAKRSVPAGFGLAIVFESQLAACMEIPACKKFFVLPIEIVAPLILPATIQSPVTAIGLFALVVLQFSLLVFPVLVVSLWCVQKLRK